jgi:LPXTG-motif cell wall-anchored protein
VSDQVYYEKFNEGSGGNETPDGPDQLKVLTGFESTDTVLNPVSGINWVPYDFSYSAKFKYAGSRSYCAKVGSGSAGMEPYTQIEIDFPNDSPLANWNNAQFVVLWVKNVSMSPLAIGGFTVTDANNGFMQVKAGSANVSLYKNGQWVTETVISDSETQIDVINLPANYEGFIRVGLRPEGTTLKLDECNVFSVKFLLVNTDPKSAVYFDDLSIIGPELSAEGASVVEPSAYFGTYQGGIVNDYNPTEYGDTDGDGDPDDNGGSDSPDTGVGMNTGMLALLGISVAVSAAAVYKRRSKAQS